VKVALFTDNYLESGKVLEPFRVELLKEFCRRCSAVILIQSNDYMDGQGSFKTRNDETHVLSALKSFRPDFVFSLNRSGLNREILLQLECPIASWYIDNPNRFEKNLRQFKTGEKVFCATKYQLDWMKAFSAAEGISVDTAYLPFCTSERQFYPDDSIPSSDMCDVSFVGTLWDPTLLSRMFNDLIQTDEQKAVVLNLFESYAEKYDEGLPTYLRSRLPNEGMAVDQWRTLVDDFISSSRRIQILRQLADLDLRIYGTRTWSGFSLFASTELFKRFSVTPIVSPKALANLYRHSRTAISIANHQAQTGFPIRIFDILATGTPLITDRHSELGELFEEGKMFLSYSSPREAREQVDQVLNNQKVAERMRTAALAEVRSKHTFANRVSTVLGGLPAAACPENITFVSEQLAEDFLIHDSEFRNASFKRLSVGTFKEISRLPKSVQKPAKLAGRLARAANMWLLALYLPIKYIRTRSDRTQRGSIIEDLKFLWGDLRLVFQAQSRILKIHVNRYRYLLSKSQDTGT